jgi:hypothetical protein
MSHSVNTLRSGMDGDAHSLSKDAHSLPNCDGRALSGLGLGGEARRSFADVALIAWTTTSHVVAASCGARMLATVWSSHVETFD